MTQKACTLRDRKSVAADAQKRKSLRQVDFRIQFEDILAQNYQRNKVILTPLQIFEKAESYFGKRPLVQDWEGMLIAAGYLSLLHVVSPANISLS